MAAPSLPKIIGLFGLTEAPDSPHERQDSTKSTITRIYEGTYAQAQGGQPEIGDTFSDLPGDVIVVGTDLQKQPGYKGRLTIDLETPYTTSYELEWVEIDEALIQNPMFWSTDAGNTTSGSSALTLQDRSMIDMWEREDDPAYKLAYQFKVLQGAASTAIGTATATSTNVAITGYTGTFNIYTLSTNGQVYAKKRLRGEEAYRIWAPVIRETSETLDAPPATKCGVLENPPSEAGDLIPAGYVWQRSADRSTRTGLYGKYRRQREWQGALFIDTDLYPSS
jgi:hypothetical protein